MHFNFKLQTCRDRETNEKFEKWQFCFAFLSIVLWTPNQIISWNFFSPSFWEVVIYPSKSLSFDFREKLVKIGSYDFFKKLRSFGQFFLISDSVWSLALNTYIVSDHLIVFGSCQGGSQLSPAIFRACRNHLVSSKDLCNYTKVIKTRGQWQNENLREGVFILFHSGSLAKFSFLWPGNGWLLRMLFVFRSNVWRHYNWLPRFL